MARYIEVTLPVQFMLTEDADVIEKIQAKARRVDAEDGEPPEDTYSLAQAITTILHNEPQWLFENALVGWSVMTDWEELAEYGQDPTPTEINEAIKSIEHTAQTRV